ncbi:hypothetical protein [Alcanivorax sp. NBRC 102028]|uniref:hypothetical protein n=1 Tax=Alcanivorax sp. NBRC 102028 TaxID=1113897 RepID=UPI000789F52C|nr:hypothetical protein [Alcanivorax sp. NBRC 102028]
MKENFKKIIHEGLKEAKVRNLDIYTFALYHDHESHVATVCIDTIESSKRLVMSSNDYSRNYFLKAIEVGDLKDAGLWNANGGRSYSLGDFALVNASKIDVPKKPKVPEFYLDMVRAIEEMKDLICMQSSHGRSLLFCCSTEQSEVGLIWS